MDNSPAPATSDSSASAVTSSTVEINSPASATSNSSAFAASATSTFDSSASVVNLSHAFANLQVSENMVQASTAAASSLAGNGFVTGQREEIPTPAPVPLFSNSICGADSSNNGGNFSGSSYLPYMNFMNPGGSVSSSINNFTSFYDSEMPLKWTCNSESQGDPFENRGVDVLDYSANDILLMAKDEDGSKYLQEALSSGDSRIIAKVFEMVFEFIFEVMTSQHGRFVFGKLIESGNQNQLQLITLKIAQPDELFLNASMDKYGSSCIKKLIRVLAKSPLISQIMFTLRRLFKHLMVDKTGSSVILQCLDNLYSKQNDFIYQGALEHCLILATHEQGCISLNKFIDEMRGRRRRQILHLISMNAACLSKNPFGNYVVQHVLALENPELIETICFVLRGHFVDLSLRKGGSHVVERCLKYPNITHHVVEEFLNSNQILQVANDSYGNYVIQTALKETMRVNRALYERLVMKLQEHLRALQFGNGRHVYYMITHGLS